MQYIDDCCKLFEIFMKYATEQNKNDLLEISLTENLDMVLNNIEMKIILKYVKQEYIMESKPINVIIENRIKRDIVKNNELIEDKCDICGVNGKILSIKNNGKMHINCADIRKIYKL